MTGEGDGEQLAPICRQVFERAVEPTLPTSGRDVMSDAALAAHVGSCVTCFRTVSEMRDAPRIAAALRAGAPTPDVADGFWDDLAARTADAAAVALRQPARRRAARAVIGFASLAVAAAAAVLLVAGQMPTGPREGAPRTHAVATTAAGPEDESASDDAVDVADLDESALRRLLDRLSARAPRHVPALATIGDAREAADAAFDDEGQMNDELAELDAPALLRIERSLAGARL